MIANVKWESCAVLHIEPGDILFVRTPEPPTDEQVEWLKAALPSGVTFVFVSPDTDIVKLSHERVVTA